MATMTPWYTPLTQAGPDWFLSIKVQDDQANQLWAIINGLSLPGFVPKPSRASIADQAESNQDWVQYLDNHTADSQLDSAETTNQWIYHSLQVNGPWLHIERGYGGYDSSNPGEMTRSENLAIRTVVGSTQLTIVSWSVSTGGGGYAHQILASGEQAETLALHLRLEDA